MPIKSPNLDDRKYKDIVEEIRTMIPRYAPQWTDWNESDPGITFIQLFAHLAEIIIFRLNQVPDKNYIEFLRLLGVQLKPPVPAMAYLTFTLSETLTDPTKDYIIIPKGTPVGTEASDDEEPVIFETEESLIAVGAVLEAVQSYDGYNFSNETESNIVIGSYFYPFTPKVPKDSNLYLGFDISTNPTTLPKSFPAVEISMRVELYTRDLPGKGQHCEPDECDISPPAQLAWEYYGNSTWNKLEVIKDETKAFLNSGFIYFRGPENIETCKQGLIDKELYWIRCRVEEAGYEYPPRIDTLLLNTVAAANAVTVKDEVVGSSSGDPQQSFNLVNTPVIPGSLVLEVDEGEEWETWTQVDDFNASTRHDKHYILDRVTGEITFGDGIEGKIPFAGVNNIKATYRHGGGSSGNVGTGTITDLQVSIADVEEVTNKTPAFGGGDEETLEMAKERAPMELKTRHRAVTCEDFQFLAIQTPGMRIKRAKAIPLYHPDFSYDLQIPGVVTVIIVPYTTEKKAVPGKGMLHTVCLHLNKHRLLTTEVYVVPPRYKQVKIDVKITVEDRYDLRLVHSDVLKNLEQYYHPLNGGPKRTGWPFGGNIYFSEAYRVVLGTPGVKRIDALDIYVDDKKQDHCKDVEIPDYYLVYSDGHDIDVYYTREEQ